MLSSDWQRSPNYPPLRGAVPAADYGDAAAFMAAYGDDLAAFAGFAADRSAAACDPEKENSKARKVHYQVMRGKLLALLRTAPAGEKEDAPKGLPD